MEKLNTTSEERIMTQINYKTILAPGKPYPTMEKEEYVKFLNSSKDSIHSGEVGIYLGRRIIEKGQGR